MRFQLDTILETGLFRSRWLLAPFYVGLVVSLGMLLWAFTIELWDGLQHIAHPEPERVIVEVLSLIDLSLAANLVLIVVFSGYENFVSKIDTGNSEDRPSWMGTLDFSGLKMKLIGSIVAISAISLLRAFIQLADVTAAYDWKRVYLLIILHLTFVISGVLFALMDYLGGKSQRGGL